jgi:hypothetical protein
MLRFALLGQGQNSRVCTRCHGMACRGSRNYWSNTRARTTGLGYYPTGSNLQPSTDRRTGFLPARSDRVSTLGEIR